MTDASGNILGVRLRRPTGFKFSVAGGNDGLFIPSPPRDDPSSLLICEGPTDAAALIDMSFFNVVGRPNCSGGIKLLVELTQRRQPAEVVIVADGDEPGQHGADNLASVLLAYVPYVRVIQPPQNLKDVRAWLQAGGVKELVQRAITAAPARRLAIRTIAVHGGKAR